MESPTSVSSAKSKGQIRAEMRRRRRGLSQEGKARASLSLVDAIVSIASDADADSFLRRDGDHRVHDPENRVVAVYLASPDEIDLTSAIEALLARGITLVAPRWNGTSYDLAKLKCAASSAGQLKPSNPQTLKQSSRSPTDLRRGPMGILEPNDPDLVVPRDVSVWLVPGLAFARDGIRLGYGGGWYDRFLAAASPSALKIGIAYDFQIVDSLPSEPHDMRLDGIVVAEIQDGKILFGGSCKTPSSRRRGILPRQI